MEVPLESLQRDKRTWNALPLNLQTILCQRGAVTLGTLREIVFLSY